MPFDESSTPRDEERPEAEILREEAANAEGSFTKRVKEARADELESAGKIGEVEEQQYRDQNWIKDKPEAEVRAYAEDHFATGAAIGDRAVKTLAEYPEKSEALEKKLEEQGTKQNSLERESLAKNTKQAMEDTLGYGLSFRSDAVELAEASRRNPEAKEELNRFLDNLSANARHLREVAAERGEIAGILHSSPPSDEYKSSHPSSTRYDTLEGVLLLKYKDIPDFEDELERVQKEQEDGFDHFEIHEVVMKADILKGDFETFLDTFDSAEAKAIFSHFLKEIESISDSSTIGNIRKLLLEANAAHINALEAELKYREQIIDDVLSGRASDPNYGSEKADGAARLGT